MLTPEERGPFGAWAKAQREERGWTVEDVVARLEDVGEPISTSYLRRIETGKLGPTTKWPSRRLQIALARVYEATPPAEEGRVEASGELAAALTRLAEIQRGQTEALTAQRTAMETMAGLLQSLIETVEDLRDVQAGQTDALKTLVTDLPVGIADALGLTKAPAGGTPQPHAEAESRAESPAGQRPVE